MPGCQQGAGERGRRENPDLIQDVPMHHITAVQMGDSLSLPLSVSTQHVHSPPFILLLKNTIAFPSPIYVILLSAPYE